MSTVMADDVVGKHPSNSPFSTAFAKLSAEWFALPMRFVVAWMFFSAAWRRTALDPTKLSQDDPTWVGHKVNQFYPHAIGIKGVLGYAIHHPEVLSIGLVIFTIIEALVGLGVAFGLLTRISAIGTAILSFFMLLGAGWLGATCLDEWQVGVWGLAGGLVVAATGPGKFSLDHALGKRVPAWTSGWRSWFTTGNLMSAAAGKKVMAGLTIFVTIAMLWTNQVFAGGVWGTLHNDSAKPHITVSDVSVSGSELTMTVYRDGGPDSYGGYVTELTVVDSSGGPVADLYGKQLSKAMNTAKDAKLIKNEMVNKVQPGPDGIFVPLGGRAVVTLDLGEELTGATEVQLRDVSIKPSETDKLWTAPIH